MSKLWMGLAAAAAIVASVPAQAAVRFRINDATIFVDDQGFGNVKFNYLNYGSPPPAPSSTFTSPDGVQLNAGVPIVPTFTGTSFPYLSIAPTTLTVNYTGSALGIFFYGNITGPTTLTINGEKLVIDGRLNFASVDTFGGPIALTIQNASEIGISGFAIVNAPSAVPEARTWAMLVVGFGMVGGGLRRRRAAMIAHA